MFLLRTVQYSKHKTFFGYKDLKTHTCLVVTVFGSKLKIISISEF